MIAYSKIFITGATSGIGYQLALACLQLGKQVIASGRNETTLKKLGDLGATGERLDLSVGEDIEKLRALIHKHKPDLFVHCAGFTQYGSLVDRPWQELVFEHTLHTQSTLAIAHTFCFLAKQEPQTPRCLMIVASAIAYTPSAGMLVYSCAKQWQLTLCRLLEIESPSHLKILCSTPGPVHSDFHLRASKGRYQDDSPGALTSEQSCQIILRQIAKHTSERPQGFLGWLAKIAALLLPSRLIARILFLKIQSRL